MNVEKVRAQFPGLTREVGGRPAVFFDGPAGSQVPRRVIDAVAGYLTQTNANGGGAFVTSHETDALVRRARGAVADFLGADDPDLITFGPSMTTLTFSLSRALARTWGAGDEVIVTQLDHDANQTPWVLAAQDAGATVHRVGIRKDDCTLDVEDFKARLSSRTRLVAFGAASNAVGTLNPVRELVDLAHEVGALTFIDAVHSAPHTPVDVAAWDCDFLACSAYKFFGPHVGILWGRRRHMDELPVYKLRPVADRMPGRWDSGTPNFEGIAGTEAAIEYLADLGRDLNPAARGRRPALLAAYEAIKRHEGKLLQRFLERVAERPELKLRGITDRSRLDQRVPTFAFTHASRSSRSVAEQLGQAGIFTWDGNFYAVSVTRALGLDPDGLVRVGVLHYNTVDEVDRLFDTLDRIGES